MFLGGEGGVLSRGVFGLMRVVGWGLCLAALGFWLGMFMDVHVVASVVLDLW